MRLFFKKLRKKLPIILGDLFCIPIAWMIAFILMHNLLPGIHALTQYHAMLMFAILFPLQILSYYLFKTYRGIWHFFSLNDVTRIIKAVIYPNFALIPLSYWLDLPHGIFPVFSLCLISALCAIRLIYQNYFYHYRLTVLTNEKPKNVLIIGAGFSGERLSREFKHHVDYRLIGFIDDDPAKLGQDIHGYRVLGRTHKLIEIAESYDIQLIIIAIPSAKSVDMRRIVSLCEQTKVIFRTLPSLSQLVNKQVDIDNVRDVNLEDLLGRDEVPVFDSQIKPYIENARIIVTGGGGSIGSELCRQIIHFNPESLLIIDNSEYNLYAIHLELTQKYPLADIQISLTSVTDEILIEELFQNFKPEMVFHAAAFKHVPMLENQLHLAVKNNVWGTQVVATASVHANVEKFILISTDKAVNPTNIMGATKRIAELYCQNLNDKVSTQFITVRFGNVLGSAGSVVPLFQKQIESGGPITVTHPDIERFFMTIPEASQLILQAMSHGHGGEIFVLDMGNPVKITYLAEQMIRLVGKEPGVDIAIEFTGLRPGEKLYEELFYHRESLLKTQHQKLFKANHLEIDWDEFMDKLQSLRDICQFTQSDKIHALVQQIVPQYHAFQERELIIKEKEWT